MCAFKASWLALVTWHPGTGHLSRCRDALDVPASAKPSTLCCRIKENRAVGILFPVLQGVHPPLQLLPVVSASISASLCILCCSSLFSIFLVLQPRAAPGQVHVKLVHLIAQPEPVGCSNQQSFSSKKLLRSSCTWHASPSPCPSSAFPNSGSCTF